MLCLLVISGGSKFAQAVGENYINGLDYLSVRTSELPRWADTL